MTGLEALSSDGFSRLRRARVGLLSHAAAVGTDGVSALDRLAATPGIRVAAVFTPEHGYWGGGGAGEEIRDEIHPTLGVPLFSLYGGRRAPTPEQWRGLDALLVDLQDLGVRCYTYVSTLRDILESAAAAGKPVIVADRPCPLAAVTDGPMLDPALESFIGHIPAPLVYGMTIGETARWLKATLRLDLDLTVIPMRGYVADGRRPEMMPWIPPSPGIRAWESAWGYPVGVFSEALPFLFVDRGGPLSFQVIAVREPEAFSKPWKCAGQKVPSLGKKAPSLFQAMENGPLWPALRRLRLPGASLHFHRYRSEGEWRLGARMHIRDSTLWRPAAAAVAVIDALQRAFGADALWNAPGARPDFFDRLFGDAAVRKNLQAGRTGGATVCAWRTAARRAFESARERELLYPRPRRFSL